MDPQDENLAGRYVDHLLPTEVHIPIPEGLELAEYPTLQTIRVAVELATYDRFTDGYRHARFHVTWPSDVFHRVVESNYGGRSVKLMREAVIDLCHNCAQQMELGDLLVDKVYPGPKFVDDLVFRYSGRFYMAPEGYDPVAIYHPAAQQHLYIFGSVNFTGYLLGVWS